MGRDNVVSRIAHRSAMNAEKLVEHGPWWDALAPDFAEQPEAFDLGLLDRLVVGTTAVSDVVLRTAGASLVGATAMPLGYHPLKLARLKRDAEFYQRLAERPVEDVYREPPRGLRVEQKPAKRLTFVPDDGRVRDLWFESTYETLNPKLRKRYNRHDRNRIAHARYWRHNDGVRPTIIAIHGFSADLYFVNQWFFEIPWLYSLGCDILLFTLPFHGPRQTRFSPFSGHGFFAGGLPRINEAFAHAIWDLRDIMNWLEARGVGDIGVTGISLGGLTTSLLATADSRLKFAIPNVPVISLADLILEWQPMGKAVRGAMKLTGTSIHEIRHMLAPSCPLTWRPAIDIENLMIVAGVGDRLAPPKHSRLLWDHWNRCNIHWFPGNHIVHLDKGAYLGEIARFLAARGFIAAR